MQVLLHQIWIRKLLLSTTVKCHFIQYRKKGGVIRKRRPPETDQKKVHCINCFSLHSGSTSRKLGLGWVLFVCFGLSLPPLSIYRTISILLLQYNKQDPEKNELFPTLFTSEKDQSGIHPRDRKQVAYMTWRDQDHRPTLMGVTSNSLNSAYMEHISRVIYLYPLRVTSKQKSSQCEEAPMGCTLRARVVFRLSVGKQLWLAMFPVLGMHWGVGIL